MKMTLCLKETTVKDVLMGTLDRLILMVTWISLDAFTEEQCWVKEIMNKMKDMYCHIQF